jgi:hypothetical protein
MQIIIPISIGELWDKYTILLIKKDKITDTDKLKHVNIEIQYFNNYINKFSYNTDNLFIKLKECNIKLWEIEDNIRIKEKNKKFDSEFIQLARLVYLTNDERYNYKKQINLKYSSTINEVKSYID